MWILLIPAIFAALILFRWARGLVSVLIAAACLWFWLIASGHAEMASIVQCRIGSYVETMPDYVCTALRKGATRLTTDGRSVLDCYNETMRHVQGGSDGGSAISIACGNIYAAKMYDATAR